jgi:hypothetical protein
MNSKFTTMKKYILLLVLLLSSVTLFSQNKAMDQLFRRYSDRDNFTSVVISRNMFKLFANVDNPDNDEFLRTIKNLDFIKILSVDGEAEGKEFYQELLAALPEKDYKELMTIKEPESQVRFFTIEREGVIRELIMIRRGLEDSSLIWMSGIIDMNTVSKISKSIHINGMEDLEKANK